MHACEGRERRDVEVDEAKDHDRRLMVDKTWSHEVATTRLYYG